jgi:hypothetical protein
MKGPQQKVRVAQGGVSDLSAGPNSAQTTSLENPDKLSLTLPHIIYSPCKFLSEGSP